MVPSCSGGVGDRFSAVVASVEAVVAPLCDGQCHLEVVAPCISRLNEQVQAALKFQKPVDYKGHPKEMFCQGGGGSSDDDECYSYEFYWGSICRQVLVAPSNLI